MAQLAVTGKLKAVWSHIQISVGSVEDSTPMHPIELRERHDILITELHNLIDAAHCLMLSVTLGESHVKTATRLINEAVGQLEALAKRLEGE